MMLETKVLYSLLERLALSASAKPALALFLGMRDIGFRARSLSSCLGMLIPGYGSLQLVEIQMVLPYADAPNMDD
jgi:hypothetical protein